MIRKLKEEYKKAGLGINQDETEYLVINTNLMQNIKINDSIEKEEQNSFKLWS